MDTRYFMKELPDSAIYLSTGQPLKFDLMETADAWLISELDAAANAHVGGVIRITKAEYELALKKKQLENLRNNSRPFRQELSGLQAHQPVRPQFQRGFPPGVHAVAAGKPPTPEPLQVPNAAQFTMPKLGKPPQS